MSNPNCPVPSNINPLSPTGFRLSISKLPDLTYFCQEVNLPEIQLPSIAMPTPLSTVGVPGEIIQYGDLTVQFLVDENLANYKGIFNWITGLGFPENYLQYQDLAGQDATAGSSRYAGMVNNYSDGVLEILSSQNTASQTILFRDLHPVAISSLPFSASLNDVNYLIGTATFRYNYYNFVDPDSTTSAAGAAN